MNPLLLFRKLLTGDRPEDLEENEHYKHGHEMGSSAKQPRLEAIDYISRDFALAPTLPEVPVVETPTKSYTHGMPWPEEQIEQLKSSLRSAGIRPKSLLELTEQPDTYVDPNDVPRSPTFTVSGFDETKSMEDIVNRREAEKSVAVQQRESLDNNMAYLLGFVDGLGDVVERRTMWKPLDPPYERRDAMHVILGSSKGLEACAKGLGFASPSEGKYIFHGVEDGVHPIVSYQLGLAAAVGERLGYEMSEVEMERVFDESTHTAFMQGLRGEKVEIEMPPVDTKINMVSQSGVYQFKLDDYETSLEKLEGTYSFFKKLLAEKPSKYKANTPEARAYMLGQKIRGQAGGDLVDSKLPPEVDPFDALIEAAGKTYETQDFREHFDKYGMQKPLRYLPLRTLLDTQVAQHLDGMHQRN